jgi:hypothetical protein
VLKCSAGGVPRRSFHQVQSEPPGRRRESSREKKSQGGLSGAQQTGHGARAAEPTEQRGRRRIPDACAAHAPPCRWRRRRRPLAPSRRLPAAAASNWSVGERIVGNCKKFGRPAERYRSSSVRPRNPCLCRLKDDLRVSP